MRALLLVAVLGIAVPAASDAQPIEPTQSPPAAEPAPAAQPAEVRDSNNALFAELLGSALLYSLNYERFIGDFSVRAGISYLPVTAILGNSGSTSTSLFAVPLTFSYLGVHAGSHILELGLGPVFVASASKGTGAATTALSGEASVVGTAIIGYRFARFMEASCFGLPSPPSSVFVTFTRGVGSPSDMYSRFQGLSWYRFDAGAARKSQQFLAARS